MPEPKTFLHRVLFIDDNVENIRIYVRQYPELELHWLPSVLCVKRVLQCRSDFDYVVIDLLGVGWMDVEAELKELETYLAPGASIILTSAIASNQNLKDVKFFEKDKVFEHILNRLT